ncbi:MAG: RNA polymerase sigma factor [Armatimonas sp.]
MSTPPRLSDEDLMARAVGGDRDAFAMLFFRHEPRLLAFLTRFMGNSSLAEDAAQEAFADAWRYRAGYDPKRRPFRVWLFALGANAARSELSRRKRRAETAEIPEVPTADTTTTVLLRSLVRDALASLPEPQRLVLVLTVYEGYSYREAAQVIGGTEIAARVLSHRARQVLKKRLSPLLESEESYA